MLYELKIPSIQLRQRILLVSNYITYALIQENELYFEMLQNCIFLEETFCQLCEIHLLIMLAIYWKTT